MERFLRASGERAPVSPMWMTESKNSFGPPGGPRSAFASAEYGLRGGFVLVRVTFACVGLVRPVSPMWMIEGKDRFEPHRAQECAAGASSTLES